jgi:hypothetical protein
MSKITVEEGQILIDAVDLVVKRRGLRVWNIETHSKYTDTLCWDDEGITLVASEHTLKWNRESEAATRVYLPIPDGWNVLADLHGRYSLTVTAWKPGKRRRVLWQRADEAQHSPDPGKELTGTGWG